ncbi:hypothetical protein F5Y09DRAFT_340312 [Xylaria sp. FL1042]|nr:hypothetical protein F5Y09DRAFT_340312 [Xylaria sp. FL1042]
MSIVQKQKEIVLEKESKLRDYKNQVDRQWNDVNVHVSEIHALVVQKANLMREVAAQELRYKGSVASLKRHEHRLAEAGRPGGNGEFEQNARNALEKTKKQCKEMQVKIKGMDKTIDKARKREQKAREKLDWLRGKLAQARLQLRAEEGKLLQFTDKEQLVW